MSLDDEPMECSISCVVMDTMRDTKSYFPSYCTAGIISPLPIDGSGTQDFKIELEKRVQHSIYVLRVIFRVDFSRCKI